MTRWKQLDEIKKIGLEKKNVFNREKCCDTVYDIIRK